METLWHHPDTASYAWGAGDYCIARVAWLNLAVHDCATGDRLGIIRAHDEQIIDVDAVGTDLYTASWDGSVRRWNLAPLAPQ